MGRTLSIELGIVCNNNCIFCYQRNFRRIKAYPKKVPLVEVLQKLEWGRENGFTHVGFEGGEPTVRDDLTRIIAHARSLGYRRISITTNGRRLSDPNFARELVGAGLNAVGFSIHGPDAQTHQAHTMRRKSFEQAMKGIRNMLELAKETRMDFNIFTVVTRLNVDKLQDIGRMFAAMGVRLLILQPMIYSKGNFTGLQDLILPMDELVTGIRSAIYGGLKYGYHVKLFNLPPCLFSDTLPGLELDPLPPSVFREDEKGYAGEMAEESYGYVRLSSCKYCAIPKICQGLPLSLLPQFDMLQALKRAVDYHRGGLDEIWLSGLEMVEPSTMFNLIRYVVSSGYRSIKLLSGGIMTNPLSYQAAIKAGVNELILVHRPRDPKSGDRTLKWAGNRIFLEQTIADLAPETKISLFSSPGEQLDDLITGLERKGLYERINTIRLTLGGQGLHLCGIRGQGLLNRLIKSKRVKIIIELQASDLFGLYPCLLWLSLRFAGRLRFQLIKGQVLITPFSRPEYSMLNWSTPYPLNIPQSNAVITVTSLRTRPLTLQRIKEAELLRRLHDAGKTRLVD